MAANYPPGGTYFDTIKRSFTAVPVDESKDNAISTTEFLEAAESLTTLFDVLGSAAFKPVKSDMTGNITVRSTTLNNIPNTPGNHNPPRKSETANSPPPSTAKPSNPSSSTNSKAPRPTSPAKVSSG